MMKHFILVVFFFTFLFFFSLAFSSIAGGHVSSSDQQYILPYDGINRNYLVHLPPVYMNDHSLPLVLAFHGGGGNAAASVNYFKLNEKADQEGFIVVYPEGTGRRVLGKLFATWNAGRCCGSAQKNNVDDVGFIAELINVLERDYNIDKKRIFATGMSNGALMVYRLACEMSDRIAAIAPSGGQDAFDGCRPSRAVSVIHFHGTQDRCSLYEGGSCGGCGAEIIHGMGLPSRREPLWQCRSVPEYLREWSMFNNCQGDPQITFQKGAVSCETYSSRTGSFAEVTLCSVEGMGHTWLGSTTYGNKACDARPKGAFCRAWRRIVGRLNADASANDLMWEFFQKHPLP